LWFGFRFQGHKGLRRLGDDLEYTGERLRILAGDWDGMYEHSEVDINTHPDHDEKLFNTPARNLPFLGIDAKASYSFWHTGGGAANRRGLVDMNHLFTDGSAQRYNGVERVARGLEGDERMSNLPARLSGAEGDVWRVQIPHR
jgi:hypothetical protein